MSTIRVTTHRVWDLLNGDDLKGQKVNLPPGEHELDVIVSPYDPIKRWLVLKGTNIGWSVGAWLQWRGEGWDEFEIAVTIDGVPVTGDVLPI